MSTKAGEDHFSLISEERVYDCGAYDGDTVEAFVSASAGCFGSVHAFEPDPETFARLVARCTGLPSLVQSKIALHPCAVADLSDRRRFAATGDAAAALDGAGAIEVRTVALDEFAQNERPTLIKMDIEGAEPEALRGAAAIIRSGVAVLCISAYHRQDHMWRLPLMIAEMNSSYRFHLRSQGENAFDLVLFAIPPARAAQSVPGEHPLPTCGA